MLLLCMIDFKTWCDTQRNIALFTFITCQVTTSAGALLSTDLVGGSISRSAGPHTIHCLCRDFPPSSSLSRKCLPVNLSRIPKSWPANTCCSHQKSGSAVQPASFENCAVALVLQLCSILCIWYTNWRLTDWWYEG